MSTSFFLNSHLSKAFVITVTNVYMTVTNVYMTVTNVYMTETYVYMLVTVIYIKFIMLLSFTLFYMIPFLPFFHWLQKVDLERASGTPANPLTHN